MPYQIIIPQSVAKAIEKIPQNFYKQIYTALQQLQREPRPDGCKKLKGYENEY